MLGQFHVHEKEFDQGLKRVPDLFWGISVIPPSILGFLRSSGSASLTLRPVAAIKVEVIQMPEQVSGSKMIKREHAKPHAQKVTECKSGVLNPSKAIKSAVLVWTQRHASLFFASSPF